VCCCGRHRSRGHACDATVQLHISRVKRCMEFSEFSGINLSENRNWNSADFGILEVYACCRRRRCCSVVFSCSPQRGRAMRYIRKCHVPDSGCTVELASGNCVEACPDKRLVHLKAATTIKVFAQETRQQDER
jgi:hypothetical protein